MNTLFVIDLKVHSDILKIQLVLKP